MFRKNKDQPDELEQMEQLGMAREVTRPEALEMPMGFEELYGLVEDETGVPLIMDNPYIRPFRLVDNRQTRLTNMTAEEAIMEMMRIEIIARKRQLTLDSEAHAKVWHWFDLMIEHLRIGMYDAIGGFKLDKITEKTRRIEVGRVQNQNKRKWL